MNSLDILLTEEELWDALTNTTIEQPSPTKAVALAAQQKLLRVMMSSCEHDWNDGTLMKCDCLGCMAEIRQQVEG